jgi:hypothetical protein
MSPLVPGGCSYLPLAKACPRCGSTSRVCQSKKGTRVHPGPKGREPRTPRTFPLQTGRFVGATMGATTAIADPFAANRAVIVGKGRAPVVAVLLATASGGRDGDRAPLWPAPSAAGPSWWWRGPCPRCGSTSCGVDDDRRRPPQPGGRRGIPASVVDVGEVVFGRQLTRLHPLPDLLHHGEIAVWGPQCDFAANR